MQKTVLTPADHSVRSPSPAPLGDNPSYDDVLDAAIEYTFPASDPIAVHSCCTRIETRIPSVS